ncbi:hypothetical protein JJJ17_01210 [Paracoccus caeni]|uniref:Uncharacterized protein n=1 Tax=Paracoccus caeni TaxID=657651 RepID=A0A934S9C6_9RHOB|nr:hypothetical protein [Paracoccus caeni]MBK4214536.1 hypothetical protein [Paracoccus caeni]
MRIFFGILLIMLGLFLMIGPFPASYYLIGLACGMNTTGCREPIGPQFVEFIFGVGAVIWIIAGAGALLIWRGRVLMKPRPVDKPRRHPPRLR